MYEKLIFIHRTFYVLVNTYVGLRMKNYFSYVAHPKYSQNVFKPFIGPGVFFGVLL